MLGDFACPVMFFSSKLMFSKKKFEYQIVWIQIRPNVMSGLDLGPNCLGWHLNGMKEWGII